MPWSLSFLTSSALNSWIALGSEEGPLITPAGCGNGWRYLVMRSMRNCRDFGFCNIVGSMFMIRVSDCVTAKIGCWRSASGPFNTKRTQTVIRRNAKSKKDPYVTRENVESRESKKKRRQTTVSRARRAWEDRRDPLRRGKNPTNLLLDSNGTVGGHEGIEIGPMNRIWV